MNNHPTNYNKVILMTTTSSWWDTLVALEYQSSQRGKTHQYSTKKQQGHSNDQTISIVVHVCGRLQVFGL